ncbi:MAG: 23S rRNA (uracil(1939)-C(5))-methyltransferase RlmD [Clostridia bacterium]|nr:23S rRNA (uracil(1939)-C(5))-methyltransferase RlmD [Clostridia bacterium]
MDANKNVVSGKRAQWFQCPDSQRCGGCQLLKLPYSAQLREKQAFVESLLSPFGHVSPIRGMENPFHYRNKVHAVFATDKSGNPISGIYQEGTHHVIPVRNCLIENQDASRIIHVITDMLKGTGWRIYNEYTHRGHVRHAVIRISESTRQIMVTLVVTTFDLPGLDHFVDALLQACPEISTIVLNLNTRVSSVVLGNREKIIYGPGYIDDILLGKRFRISSRSFYQVNSRQTEVLYQTAIDLCHLKGQETLLDAYCGTGTIGICASDHVHKLIGVEINKSAVDDARINASVNHVNRSSFYVGDAGKFMHSMNQDGKSPDIVIMDPPRSGSSDAFLSAILACLPSTLLYISCNPETLQRDLHTLIQGYNVEAIIPVDMFPCTHHVETVCLLTHKG